MSSKNLEAFRDEVQDKIKQLLKEFGSGKISNEQFDILYERYSNQLDMANRAIEGTQAKIPGTDTSTIAIRQATAGKAIGLAIYHHRSGIIIETLGKFELAPEVISPTLNKFSDKIESREFIEPVTKKLGEKLWVVFMARKFTTVIVIFQNEPAPVYIRELERLLHDFEEANHRYLDQNTVDPSKLARPFQIFVRKKLGG